jgi:alpha-galactosidase
MPPIGRRSVLKLVAGGVAASALPFSSLAQAAVRVAASAGKAIVQDGQLAIAFDERLHTRLARRGAFVSGWQPSEQLLLEEGTVADFAFSGQRSSTVKDPRHGAGSRTVVSGRSAEGIEKQVQVTFYTRYPGLALLQTRYTNHGTTPVETSGWRSSAYALDGGQEGFWSFSGASHTDRRDWVQPVTEGFDQPNSLGMHSSDYGGGTPVANIWRRDLGLAVGHVEPVPRPLEMPVRHTGGGASIAIQSPAARTLEPGKSLVTETTFVCLHAGDYFSALELYRYYMQGEGIIAPEAPASAFDPVWCAWGYERNFTMEQVLGTLPKVKELGLEWVVLDDGWQTNEGDWVLDPVKFPNGDQDMRDFVAQIKAQGLKPRLWIAPLAADPGSEILFKHPEMLLLDADGGFQKVTWWNSLTQCPGYQPVVDYYVALTKKIIGDWGFDGLKIDGHHLNAVAPCYNPAHNHSHPEESCEKMGKFWEAIHRAAHEANPEAVVELCPCGTAFSFHSLPGTDQFPSSDPLSSWQIRHKGKTFKALAGSRSSYAGDHVELSDNGDDWATSVGIGAVISTKFNWPHDITDHKVAPPPGGLLLTAEREATTRKWVELYNTHMLPKGEYLGSLYDIGFDKPEAHAIRKDGAMYYTFYADRFDGSVQLRGLGKGRYKVRDLFNGTELGSVDAQANTLQVGFTRFLFLQATPEAAA